MSDPLIERLVSELRPVQRLPSPALRAGRFGIVACAAMVGAVWLAGGRADGAGALCRPIFLGETAALVVLFASATVAALSSAVPGAEAKRAAALLGLSATAWLGLIALRAVLEPGVGGALHGGACLVRTLLLGALPGAVLLGMLGRSAPLESRRSGLFAFVAASALAVLGTRALCGKDDALHVMVFHFGPVVVAALAGFLTGRYWLERRRARALEGKVRP